MTPIFHFSESYEISGPEGSIDIPLIFRQTPKGVIFIGSFYAPVIINPSNVTSYIAPVLWDKFLSRLNHGVIERSKAYELALEKDNTIGSLENPL